MTCWTHAALAQAVVVGVFLLTLLAIFLILNDKDGPWRPRF